MSNNNFVLYLNKRGEQANFSWLKNLEKIISKEFKLKQVYRHKNKVTDVLSFNLDSTAILGEVVICLAVAKKQAKENKKSLSAELKLLTIHGILHLLAFDHELNEAEYNKQEEMQNKILKQISGIRRSRQII